MPSSNHSLDAGLGDPSSEILHGRYRILQLLGKKAGRQTWLATDLETQQPVVIKLLSFNQDFQWDDLKLFEREAATLQSLSHPAIPSYLNYFEVDSPAHKGFALVQTYIEAKSLEQHLKTGRSFSEAEVKQLAKALLGILDYLHSRQPPVIHRDLKPSNILLTDRSGNSPGQVYLVDFGSVQTLAAREGGTITVVGTYGYMPPEQFGGRAVPASDLYSLGATLICLVTGRHPADLPQTDLRLEFEGIANLSPSFTSWLKWLTEPSLSKRPASAYQALQGQQRDGKAIARIPINTDITITRAPNFLDVQLPSRKLFLLLTLPRVSLWIWIGLGIMLLPSVFWVTVLLFALLGTVSWLLLLFVLSYFLLPWSLGRTRLCLNQEKLWITRTILGWEWTQREMPRRHLWRLEMNAPAPHCTRLRLWLGTQKAEIRGTSAEIQWLASELSTWLDMLIEDKAYRP